MIDHRPKCELCGESMPEGEEMFKYHGHSGPCPKPPLPKTKTGVQVIADERKRQIESEGWTPEHDDEHNEAELTEAARSYCWAHFCQTTLGATVKDLRIIPDCWPEKWDRSWWKPSSDPIRNLARAGALIAAEIDRIQRKASTNPAKSDEVTAEASAAEVDRSAKVLSDGSPVPQDDSHTHLRPDGQQEGYVVLSAEERAKGFVRKVRTSYKHVGAPGPLRPLRDLTNEEKERYASVGYIKYEEYKQGEGINPRGRYWTQEQLDNVGKGCGTVTSMGASIAEIYARDPGFYSGTFCVRCGKHFPVGKSGEFVWLDDGTRVGS